MAMDEGRPFTVSVNHDLTAILGNYAISAAAEAEKYVAEIPKAEAALAAVNSQYQDQLSRLNAPEHEGARQNVNDNWQHHQSLARTAITDAKEMASLWKAKAKLAKDGFLLVTRLDTGKIGFIQSDLYALAQESGRVKYALNVDDLAKLLAEMGIA